MTNPRLQFEFLLELVLEEVASEADQCRLDRLLSEHPELLDAYLDQVRMHAILQIRSGVMRTPDSLTQGAAVIAPPSAAPSLPRLRRSRAYWAAAAVVLAAVAAGVIAWQGAGQTKLTQEGFSVALKILETNGLPRETAEALTPGQSIKLDTLRFAEGRIRFSLPSGAMLSVAGPAAIQLRSPTHLSITEGKLTADVGPGGRGLTIDTPQTQVVDLGTVFGVEVANPQRTSVVVFEGSVELYDPLASRHVAIARLTEGEAVDVDGQRRLSRIDTVITAPSGEDWATAASVKGARVIKAVRDNVKDRRFYGLIPRGMVAGATAYARGQERRQWFDPSGRSLPLWLDGADLVQTLQHDRLNTELELTVTLSQPATLMVLHDTRSPPPRWLRERFTDTGAQLLLGPTNTKGKPSSFMVQPDESRFLRFSVWSLVVLKAGDIALGPATDDKPGSCKMYGIAAKALP